MASDYLVPDQHEKGNALFLILIAVALFAALSYAITQSGRGRGTITKEQAMIDLTKLSDFAATVQQAVMRLKLINHCSNDQISFSAGNNSTSKQGDGTVYDYTNPNAPVDGSCDVFSPNGGNVTPPDPIPDYLTSGSIPSNWMDRHSWIVTASRILGHGSDAADATGTDLVLWLGFLTREQCININNKLGITNPGGDPPIDGFDCNSTPFNGTYPACSEPMGNDVAQLAGKSDFCAAYPSTPQYTYYHVMIDR